MRKEREDSEQEGETLIQLIRGRLSRVMTPTLGSVILQVAQGKQMSALLCITLTVRYLGHFWLKNCCFELFISSHL